MATKNKLPETEIDNQAKKNAAKIIQEGWARLDIKRHNIKAAMKAERASNPDENYPILGGLINKRSDKIKKLNKAYMKVHKADKFLDKQSDRLEKDGIWNKNEGSAIGYYEKKKLLNTGMYRDKHGGTTLDTEAASKMKFKEPVSEDDKFMLRQTAAEGGEIGPNPFSSPVPGESLTTAPDMPKSWERPSQITDKDEAMENVYMEITSDENLGKLISIIDEGTPLSEIAQVILYRAYTQGIFNPDLMLLLAEPTIYLLVAIADYADIKDYVLYEGEEDDSDNNIPDDNEVPINVGGEDDNEPTTKDKFEKPKAESLGASLLERVQTELPSKVEEFKETVDIDKEIV